MRAVSYAEFGRPEVLHVAEVPVPEPGPGQVRVRVAASVVHPVDLMVRSGRFPAPLPTGSAVHARLGRCRQRRRGRPVGRGVQDRRRGHRLLAVAANHCRRPRGVRTPRPLLADLRARRRPRDRIGDSADQWPRRRPGPRPTRAPRGFDSARHRCRRAGRWVRPGAGPGDRSARHGTRRTRRPRVRRVAGRGVPVARRRSDGDVRRGRRPGGDRLLAAGPSPGRRRLCGRVTPASPGAGAGNPDLRAGGATGRIPAGRAGRTRRPAATTRSGSPTCTPSPTRRRPTSGWPEAAYAAACCSFCDWRDAGG